MALVITLTGDVADLESKLMSAGGKIEAVGDKAKVAGDQAGDMKGSLDKVEASLTNMEAAALRTAAATEKLEGGTSIADSLADGFGNTERTVAGLNDVMGVLAEQFGVNLGPAQEYASAAADVAGGMEGIIGGGMALGKQLAGLPATMGPAIASTWAQVTALYAQAAATIAANLPLIAIIATFALLAAGVVLVVKHWDEVVEKFPVLGEVVETIKTKLGEFTDWITGTFVPGVASLYDPAVKVPLELIVSYFQMQFELVKIGVETVLGVIKGVVDVFMGIFTGDWQRAWDGVKAIVDALWEGIKGAFNLGMGFLTDDLLPRIGEAGRALGGAIKDGFVSGIQGLIGLGSDIANGVLGMLESALNRMVSIANSALPDRVGISVAGQDLGFDIPQFPSFSIPRLAAGMWSVPGPEGVDQFPALLAGGEMVVPSREAEAMRNSLTFPGAAGGGGNFTIEIPGLSVGAAHTIEELEALRKLINSLDADSRKMWWNDPKNKPILQEFIDNYFQLNFDRSISGRPGSEPGAGPLSPGAPPLGGSAGSSNNKPAATTPGGALKADEEMMQLMRDQKRNGDLTVDLLKAVLDIFRRPQVIEFMLKTDPKAFANMLAPFIVDPLAQISRRQNSWSPS